MSSTGTTALAPGCRIISSDPVDPSGKRTTSTSSEMIRPVYFRTEETRPGSSVMTASRARPLLRGLLARLLRRLAHRLLHGLPRRLLRGFFRGLLGHFPSGLLARLRATLLRLSRL